MAPAEPERTTASVGPKCTGGPRLRSPTLSTIRTGDVEIADEFDKTSHPKTKNGQTIAIRRSSGEKVLTIWSPGEQWNAYLQPLDITTNPCTFRSLIHMRASENVTGAAPMRGLVGRAASAPVFDLDRWAPSGGAARFVEHFWSVSWDLREQHPFDSTVITFPSMHITHEWGEDGPRHGFALPNTLVHGVVERVFVTTISARGAVVGARFRPGGFSARFNRDAALMTGRVVPVDDELFSRPIHLDADIAAASARLDDLLAADSGSLDPTYVSLTALVDRIRDDARLHRVEQVMEQSPWSARTTQRVFRRYVGVPVKWVLCRYRLQQAALEIESHPDVDFADLAVRLGWYDQAHFINDFRSMLGSTPGEYAARHGS